MILPILADSLMKGGNDLIIILTNIHDLHAVYEYDNFIY